MFTGIIEETGTVERVERKRDSASIVVRARAALAGTRVGDSIAVNGVCLTAARIDAGSFTADVMPETLERSGIGALRAGDRVNLERAATMETRLGGHLVQGHVDGTAKIVRVREDGNSTVLTVECDPRSLAYIVDKGSVTLDGVSLTSFGVDARGFSVSLAPHTFRSTTLSSRRAGDRVNLECDIVAKHAQKLLRYGRES